MHMTDRYNRIYAALPHNTATQLFVLGRWQVVSRGGTFTVVNRADEQPDAPILSAGRTFRSRENCPAGKLEPL
jgi:hypothetical protein